MRSTDTYSENLKEHRSLQRQFQSTAAAALMILAGGSVFYHIVEHLRWLDAVYFSTITLATVGYGDITPHTDAGKLFTIFYVLVGIGIIGIFANLLLKNSAMKRELRRAKRELRQSART